MRRSRSAHWLVLTIFCIMVSRIQPAYAQGWIPPMRISQSDYKSWFPDVAADATGAVHIVWSSHERVPPNTYDLVMYARVQDGQLAQAPNDIMATLETGLIQAATRPALFLDAGSLLHMTYRDESNVYYTNVPASEAGVPQAWRPVYIAGTGYFSRVARDSQGRLHMAMTDVVSIPDCAYCLQMFYSWSDDDGRTWKPPKNISVFPTGAAKPQMVIDSHDNVHLVWEAGSGGSLGQLSGPTEVVYAVSRDRGLTWSDPQDIGGGRSSDASASAKNPAIAIDKQGRLIVAWLGTPEDALFYQISADLGQSWSAPVRIPGIWGSWTVRDSRLDSYSMAVDSDGNVHLVMAGRLQESLRTLGIYHFVWDGMSWSNPEAVVAPNEQAPQWPRIAVGLGNQLHVVWFMLNPAISDPDADRGYDVYYSRGVSKSAAISPARYPTLAVQITPTPALPTTTPATPLPQLPMSTPSANWSSLSTEMDDVAQLLLTIVPTAILLGLALLFILLRRRRV